MLFDPPYGTVTKYSGKQTACFVSVDNLSGELH